MTPAWDLIIVGCGPVGALAANLVGRAGMRTLVVDREQAPYSLPRAVHVDHEMLRLLEQVGLLAPLRARLLEAHGHLHIGADRGVIRYLSAVGKPQPFGYANDYFFYQPELEAELRRGLARYDAVTLRLGAEVVGLTQVGDEVRVRMDDGRVETTRWVLGTDGACSTVRKAIGVELDDLNFEEPWLVVDAEVDGPLNFPGLHGVPEGADLQKLSVMLCDPARPTTIVPGRGNHRRWEFMLLPGEDDRAMAEPARVRELIAPWVAGRWCRVVRAATYRFHGLVAKKWMCERVFLAGDAAHQTPPFFGQGMCHGFRDVANLAWKLALVDEGRAGRALLDTYQSERDPQVRHVIGKAIEAGRYICVLDSAAAAERDARVRATKDIRTAAELIAPIQSSIVGHGAGQRFINPQVDGGRHLLDAATGGGWVLLLRHDTAVSPLAEAILRRLTCRRFIVGRDIDDSDGHLTAWFDEHAADAVWVRPDFYVAAACEAKELSTTIERLGASMHATTFPASGLRSVELIVRDPIEAARFYVDAWGLVEAGRTSDAVWLRGTGPDPYVLRLRRGEAVAIESMTFRAAPSTNLRALRQRMIDAGARAERDIAPLDDVGGGEGVTVRDSVGRCFRVVQGDEPVEPLTPVDSRPGRLAHVNINTADIERDIRFFEDGLGFRLTDRSRQMAFLRTNADHHAVVLAQAPVDTLNHIAFNHDAWEDVMKASGRMCDAGHPIGWGPGRHGPGDNVFVYFVDPFGVVIEHTAEVLVVDDTYRVGRPDDWTWPEGRTDQWGIAPPKTHDCKAAQLAIPFV